MYIVLENLIPIVINKYIHFYFTESEKEAEKKIQQ